MFSKRSMSTKKLKPSDKLLWVSAFILANSLIAMLLGLRYFKWMSWPSTTSGWIYFISTWPSHYWLLTALFCLPLFALALLPIRRTLLVISSLLAASGLILLWIDATVFDQYRFHISAFVIDLLLNDPNNQIIDFSLIVWLSVIIGLGVLIAAEFLLSAFLLGWTVRNKPKLRVWHFTLLFMLICSHLIHIWADAMYRHDIVRQPRFYPLMQPASAYSFMQKRGWVNEEARSQAASLSNKNSSHDINYPLNALNCSPKKEPLNILMIVIDSVRADALELEAMPNTQKLASDGRVFTNHLSGSNSTRGGLFSLLYGIPATYWDTFKTNMIPSAFITTLQSSGYNLGIFASAQLTKPEFDRTIFASIKNLRMESEGNSPANRDRNLTNDWFDWLNQNENSANPFFGFLFYDAPHGFDYPDTADAPFQPAWDTVNYLLLNQDLDPTPFFNRYLNATHYTDSLVGEVIEDLKQRNLYDNTVIIVTSDHGKEFNDLKQNYWGHNSNFSRYQLQVPMVVKAPNIQAGTVHNGQTSHYDVVPTIMSEWLGCQNAFTDYSIGENLLDDELNRSLHVAASYIEYALIKNHQTLVIDHTGNYELLDENYKAEKKQQVPTWAFELMPWLSWFYKN